MTNANHIVMLSRTRNNSNIENLISRSEETMCRLCDNEEGSYDHLWLRCPAFDADRQRLDLGASLEELVRLPERAQALLRIILRCLG